MEALHFPETDDGNLTTVRTRVDALAVLLRAAKSSVDHSAMVEASAENLDGPDPNGHWNTLKGEIDRVLNLLAR